MCVRNKIRALFRFDEFICAIFVVTLNFFGTQMEQPATKLSHSFNARRRCTMNSICDSFVPIEVTRRICAACVSYFI